MMMPALFNWFKKEEKTLPAKEQAISEVSNIYTAGSFEKYNPDDLIGRKGFTIYKKMMLDEQIKAVVKFKRDAITSRDFVFELDHEKYDLTEEEADRRIAISYAYLDEMQGSWMDTLNNIMSAMYNGYSMSEKVFRQIDVNKLTYWGIDRIKLRPFDTFIFKADEYSNVEEVIQKVSGVENKIDLEKFIHYVMNPDVDEHYGQSELREAYRSWFSKDAIIKFRNMWLERHAGGFRWIQPKDGQTINPNSAEYTKLQAVLANIQTSTGMILPSTLEMHSDYPSNNVAFADAIVDYDMSIARALLVPNLLGVSPQGKHGSQAQADTQIEAFMWTLEADSMRLVDSLNEQLFRQLGDVNFGDSGYPRYKMKPVSNAQKYELVRVWKELVEAGAVKHSDADEEYVRELMEFPAKTEEEEDDANTDVQPTGDDDQTPNGDTPADNDDASKPDGDDDNAKPGAGPNDGQVSIEETVVGKGRVAVSAFNAAQRRVDFAVIANSSDAISEDYTAETAKIMDLYVADLIDKAKTGGELTEDVSANIAAMKPNVKLKQKMNRTQAAMLKESFNLGVKHASIEIDKAKRTAYSRRVDMKRVDMIADDYFKTKAFKIAGNFTDEALSLIETEILNGAKYGRTWVEVEAAIYQTFASRGLISPEQAREALGDAMGVEVPDARIRTVVRTNTFDAINEARHGYFTDPELGGFVQAFEYSAILDGRTTAICRHLDDEDRGNHSAEWYEANPQFRPPNHYNCRSLLVPVTVVDIQTYVEGGDPTMQPQEGFR